MATSADTHRSKRKRAASRCARSRGALQARRPSEAGGPADASTEGDDIETHIYRTVFDSVMSQRLAPGTKLPEAALCELFGVSRSMVRKVLQRLAHDHIVELRPNRGAIVAVPTREETRQIFEARRALEAAIVALAAERATKADLSALRAQLHEEHQAVHRFDQPAWARLASSFHLRLAELAAQSHPAAPPGGERVALLADRGAARAARQCVLRTRRACAHRRLHRARRRRRRGALMDRHLRELEQHLAGGAPPSTAWRGCWAWPDRSAGDLPGAASSS